MLLRSLTILTACAVLLLPLNAPARAPAASDWDLEPHRQAHVRTEIASVAVEAISPRPTGSGGSLGLTYGPVVPTSFDAGPAARIWYVTQGLHAVPALDMDASGVPDFVESLAEIVVEVTARYEVGGLRRPLTDANLELPDDGGDGRFDIYLVDFFAKYQAAVTDGHLATEFCEGSTPRVCGGFILIENDFAGFHYPSVEDALLTLFSHEYAHAVGAAYAAGTSTWWDEGQATWAEHAFADIEHDVIRLASRWFAAPATALDDPTGPGGGWGYAGSTFILHLAAVHGDALVRETWEALGAGSARTAVGALDFALQQRGSSVQTEWDGFATAAWFTGTRAGFSSGTAIPFAGSLPELSPRSIQIADLPYRHTSAKWSADYVRFDGLVGRASTYAISPCTAEGPVQGVRMIEPMTHAVRALVPGGPPFTPSPDAVFVVTGNPRRSAAHCVIIHDASQVPSPEPCEGEACEPGPCEGDACEPGPCEGDACEPEPAPEPCLGKACEPTDEEHPGDAEGCSSTSTGPAGWPLLLIAVGLVRRYRRSPSRETRTALRTSPKAHESAQNPR